MRTRNGSGPTTGETILLHPERQKGLQGKIAAARAKRLDAGLDREAFMDDATPEPPEAFETTHQAFREELRRIIAGDAERAANEAGAPLETEPALPQVSRFTRIKTRIGWSLTALVIGLMAFGALRPT